MSKSASQLNEKTTPSLREQEEPSPTQSAVRVSLPPSLSFAPDLTSFFSMLGFAPQNSSIQELAASHGIEAAFEAKGELRNLLLSLLLSLLLPDRPARLQSCSHQHSTRGNRIWKVPNFFVFRGWYVSLSPSRPIRRLPLALR